MSDFCHVNIFSPHLPILSNKLNGISMKLKNLLFISLFSRNHENIQKCMLQVSSEITPNKSKFILGQKIVVKYIYKYNVARNQSAVEEMVNTKRIR